jgi:hypothetical protein
MICVCLCSCLQENVNRLKAYKSNLVVFPRARNAKKPKVRHVSGQRGQPSCVVCSQRCDSRCSNSNGVAAAAAVEPVWQWLGMAIPSCVTYQGSLRCTAVVSNVVMYIQRHTRRCSSSSRSNGMAAAAAAAAAARFTAQLPQLCGGGRSASCMVPDSDGAVTAMHQTPKRPESHRHTITRVACWCASATFSSSPGLQARPPAAHLLSCTDTQLVDLC